jgi:hypothetical protein
MTKKANRRSAKKPQITSRMVTMSVERLGYENAAVITSTIV